MYNGKFIGDLVKLCTLALGIIVISKTYYDNTDAFHLPKSNYAKAIEVQRTKQIKTKKRALLDKSYEDMMCDGDNHMYHGEFVDASRRYFDAKSIYPERFEPRISLCRSLMKLSEQTDYFLPATQKEIHFAFNYSHATNDDRLLDELCQMDKDVIQIFEQAKTKFKYWDELMTLEDY